LPNLLAADFREGDRPVAGTLEDDPEVTAAGIRDR
jgi:hypothetical protein